MRFEASHKVEPAQTRFWPERSCVKGGLMHMIDMHISQGEALKRLNAPIACSSQRLGNILSPAGHPKGDSRHLRDARRLKEAWAGIQSSQAVVGNCLGVRMSYPFWQYRTSYFILFILLSLRPLRSRNNPRAGPV